MSIESLRDIVARLGDPDGSGYAALFGALAPDVEWTVVGTSRYSGTYRGANALLQELLMPLASEMTETGRMVVDNVICGENDVVLQAHAEGRVAKSGHHYDNNYCIVFHAPDGVVTKVTEYCDTELVTAAFGR